MELDKNELEVVKRSVRDALDLRKRYVNIPYDEDAKMKRKKARMNNKEIPLLKSALKKLNGK